MLNKGTFWAVDSNSFPYYSFNWDSAFERQNAIIELIKGDTLLLDIRNNTLDTHLFEVVEFGISIQLVPGGSSLASISSDKAGIYRYSDYKSEKAYSYRGASGMLIVTEPKWASVKKFYWNIKDLQSSYIRDLDSAKSVDWKAYYPDYFVVNGLGKPQLVGDSLTNVKGSVGDSILIMVANTGKAVHSIHFHGYHCTAIESTSTRVQKGSSKDTFPFNEGDALVLLLIPDKTGMYPVHDHNLIAVSGGGKYPNGVFMMINIQ